MKTKTLRRPPPPHDIGPLLPAETVCTLFHICHRTLYGWVRDKRFPAPVRIGKRKLWPAGVVRDFLAGEELRVK
jgi:predicted DNA-binding transcriptional regulator AlpA